MDSISPRPWSLCSLSLSPTGEPHFQNLYWWSPVPWTQATTLLLLVFPSLMVHPASALEPARSSHIPVCRNEGPLTWTSLVPRIPILSSRLFSHLGSLNQPVSIPPDSSGFYGLWAHGQFMWISHFSVRMSQTLWHIRFACRVVKNAHAQDILNQSISPGGQCEVTIRHIDYGIRRTEFDSILAQPHVICVLLCMYLFSLWLRFLI